MQLLLEETEALGEGLGGELLAVERVAGRTAVGSAAASGTDEIPAVAVRRSSRVRGCPRGI